MNKHTITNICAWFSVIVFCYFMIIMSIIMYFNAPNSYHREDKRFIIESGMTLRQVVEKLHQERIIKNPETFLYIAQVIKGIDPKVRYGEYFFEKNTSYYKILHKMIRGYIYFRKVTVAEGLSTKSAIENINKAPGIIGQIPENIAEGSLLPETYFYSYNDTKAGIVKRMQSSMQKVVDDLWEKRDMSIPLRTKEQAIILASIVEKEAASPAEMPQVASVFINRLRKNMKLQSDPTIIYSYAFGDKSLERPIRMSDIRNNSNYNTYHIYGLPPAPICNPGIAAIKSVLNPPATEYLYFVASGKGDHVFATNINDHNANVARYRSLIKTQEVVAQPTAANPAAVNTVTEITAPTTAPEAAAGATETQAASEAPKKRIRRIHHPKAP